jgi:hypothetical protein
MKLEITTSNRKGGMQKTDTYKGYVKIMTNSAEKMPTIIVDAFEGSGDTYRELDQPQVRVYHEDGRLIFKGTLFEFSALIDNALKP